MGVIFVATKIKEKEDLLENRKDLKKLIFYVVIVNYGQSNNIVKLFKNNKSSAQFIQMGQGTATKDVLDILDIEDNRKEIIYSLIREDCVEDVKKEIEAYFAISKKNRGIAFTVALDSIIGVKMYKFFSQTVRG